MVDGMTNRGYQRDFAERCFRQIEGFGTYGFPESHAASFALLVYVSAWLKCHHPAAFACALLNSQPMGFYAPAQIVSDARTHGVSIRAPDANLSTWDSLLEPDATLRLGLRQINGFRKDWADTITRARPFQSFADLTTANLPHQALVALADADALRSLNLDRRTALWHIKALDRAPALPLFTGLPIMLRKPDLPTMPLPEHVKADYQTTGLSLKAHPLRFLRPDLAQSGHITCAEANTLPNNARFQITGIVLVRQRPGSANGVVFATIEDETGTANVVVWPSLLETYRSAVLGSALLYIRGTIQRSPEGITHLVAEHLENHTAKLTLTDLPTTPGDELPRSRDFR